MARLFRAFLFKLKRDLAFRITLIVGAAVALLMAAAFLLIDALSESEFKAFTGPTMLLVSISPVANYGIAIPVNIVSFICLEFTQGSIRNKIIAGNSKFKIYASLCISGLIYGFALLTVYAAVCTGLGCIFGGFNLSKEILTLWGSMMGYGIVDGAYIAKAILICLFIFLNLIMFATFLATAFRTTGATIPLTIVGIVMLYYITFFLVQAWRDDESMKTLLKVIDPMYGLCVSPEADGVFVTSLLCNTAYAGIFFGLGSLMFAKRDVK